MFSLTSSRTRRRRVDYRSRREVTTKMRREANTNAAIGKSTTKRKQVKVLFWNSFQLY
jgi:hypothetical protein